MCEYAFKDPSSGVKVQELRLWTEKGLMTERTGLKAKR